jgi:predicted TIM-barrel fold metal-dependent hydrolase
VLFSVDYPYENYQEIGAWFDSLELDGWTLAKVGWENAAKLLKLPA